MARVMAVSFERYGRLYYLDAGEENYRVGDRVLVPTDGGLEVAECVWAPEWVTEDFGELPVCAGRASEVDLERDAANKRRRAEAKIVAKQLIKKHELPMKVVGVDYLDHGTDFDELVVIYFTAPGRVDFRPLVGDLARSMRARIDLRQIGSRDAARITGGIGSCGRDLCCATFLKDFEPVSLRLAKTQDLPANPLRISGACGRLMCCLKYEHPLYAEFARTAPEIGSRVETGAGEGVVIGHQVPADAVLVRMRDSGMITSCSKASVCGSRTAYDSRDTADGESGDGTAARVKKRRRRRRALDDDQGSAPGQ
jgi:cell fate regulator YaaT (PSP1 superfamily)